MIALKMVTGLIATAALGMATQAIAETVNINTAPPLFGPVVGPVGNTAIFTGTANGTTISALASAWSATRNADGSLTFASSRLVGGILGLGVLSEAEGAAGSFNGFGRMDNADQFDFILFQFDRDVTITSAVMNAGRVLNGLPDNESSVGAVTSAAPWNTVLDLSDPATFAGLSMTFNDIDGLIDPSPIVRTDVPFHLPGMAGNVWMIGATLNNQDIVTFGNGSTESFDAYYLARLTVNSVPEPASWAMMLAGFGLVGAGMRRRAPRRVTYAG
ncbi:PEPxxWA-CTERM sorting domain-containing protein [Sphingomonas flavalba]|uniref:PEPxxWA-CTERM sorting domain-containing protein n=1 Tax=Sphingomonas flavalba TaxID=2559804 RepID=UPI001EF14263|nr:PEPxxWA-CTERM sorting domain-containing protein [Sphingomonas flavalba]